MTDRDHLSSDPEAGTRPVRIAVVEDHTLICDALAAVLQLKGHVVLVPELTATADLEADLVAFRPDLLLLDLDLGPGGNGKRLIRPLTGLGTQVLILSATTDEAEVGETLCLGAVGWVPKYGSFDQLLQAVLVASRRGALMDAAERDRLMRAWRRRQAESELSQRPFQSLTKREAAVLAGLMEGRSVERIAADSYVSISTVRSQVRAILCKLGVNSQLEAVALAARVGWSSPTRALAAAPG